MFQLHFCFCPSLTLCGTKVTLSGAIEILYEEIALQQIVEVMTLSLDNLNDEIMASHNLCLYWSRSIFFSRDTFPMLYKVSFELWKIETKYNSAVNQIDYGK